MLPFSCLFDTQIHDSFKHFWSEVHESHHNQIPVSSVKAVILLDISGMSTASGSWKHGNKDIYK